MSEDFLLMLAGVVVLGIGAQWIANRLRLPSILLLLLAGFLAGPVIGFIKPDELLGDLLFPVVSVAVAIILFEGGLTLRLSELPRLGNVIFRLISIGALVTWVIVTVSAHYLIGLEWSLAILLGAILIVTGPTVIGPLLRQIRPKGKTATALKWEGILIDPVGAVLAVLIFEAILDGEIARAPSVLGIGVLQTLLIGGLGGFLSAGLIIVLFRRFWVPDHLQNSMTLLVIVGSFAVSNLLHPEAGLVTVTIMGIILANQKSISIKHIVEFKESLQVLLIGTLFILLAARLRLETITETGWQGLAFLGVIVLVARPLSVFVSTLGSDLKLRERVFLAWMAPRGIVAAAVASVFSFELVEAGFAGSEQIVSLTFLVIVSTVMLYGLTSGFVARRMGLAEQNPQGVLIVGAHEFGRALARQIKEIGFRVVLIDTDPVQVYSAEREDLPVCKGNALSEAIFDSIDFTGIGRIMAMTSNEEVNVLSMIHFRELFERSELYQMVTDSEYDKEEDFPQHLSGRYLFGPSITVGQARQSIKEGAQIRACKITNSFDYTDYQMHYSSKAIPLFLKTERGRLIFYTTDYRPIPKAGQTLVGLTPPIEAPVVEEETVEKESEQVTQPAA